MTATWPEWDWPDVTALVVDHLDAGLSVPVRTRVPDPRPDAWVRVQRVGGVASGPIDTARVLVECWAAQEADAAALAATTRDLMRRMPGTVAGYRVARVTEAGGPALIADPLTGTPRYWSTFEVVVRADPAGS